MFTDMVGHGALAQRNEALALLHEQQQTDSKLIRCAQTRASLSC